MDVPIYLLAISSPLLDLISVHDELPERRDNYFLLPFFCCNMSSMIVTPSTFMLLIMSSEIIIALSLIKSTNYNLLRLMSVICANVLIVGLFPSLVWSLS